jgi:hypothetical protein
VEDCGFECCALSELELSLSAKVNGISSDGRILIEDLGDYAVVEHA